MSWRVVLKMPAKDKRYKITAELIATMQKLREEGKTQKAIKEIMREDYGLDISESTVNYWVNAASREQQRLKNARRRYVSGSEENQRRIERDAAKRKENWEADPAMRLRHEIQGALGETRSQRHTIRGIPMEDAKRMLESGELKKPNRKFD